MKVVLPIALIAVTTLAACATGPEMVNRRVAYTCDGGPPVTVIYAGETARLETADGESIALQRRKSGSGLWYESPTHTVRSRGDEIVYTIGRRAPMICRAAVTPQPR